VHRSRSLAALWATTAAAAALTTTCVLARGPTTAADRGAGAIAGAFDLQTHPAPADPAGDGAELADGAIPVILVVLDGVRWQEMFGGVDPVLAATHRAGPVVDARTLLPSLYAALDSRGAAIGAPGRGLIAAS
jgi:hypothetical protein